jgi:hypothetical protein
MMRALAWPLDIAPPAKDEELIVRPEALLFDAHFRRGDVYIVATEEQKR